MLGQLSTPAGAAASGEHAHAPTVALFVLSVAATGVAVYEQSRIARVVGVVAARRGAEIARTPLSYGAHAVELVAVVSLALIGFLRWNRAVPNAVRWFVLLQLAGAFMTFRGFSLAELGSAKVAGPTGPLLSGLSMLAFVGVGKADFQRLMRLLEPLAFVLCVVVLHAVSSLRAVTRDDAVAVLRPWLDPLYWLAAWLLLQSDRGRLFAWVRWVPLLVYVIGSIVVQTRLNLVMALLLVIADLYVAAKRTGRSTVALARTFALLGLLLVSIPVVMTNRRLASTLDQSLLATRERLTEDSRSSQLTAFFRDLSPAELVVGRGAGATWNWPGMSPEWAGATDVGYLSLLLFGGIPLLWTYVLFHLAPAWRVLRQRSTLPELAPAVIVTLFSVRMLSSEFPTFKLEYYLVLLCVGRCLAATVNRRPMRARFAMPSWRGPPRSRRAREPHADRPGVLARE